MKPGAMRDSDDSLYLGWMGNLPSLCDLQQRSQRRDLSRAISTRCRARSKTESTRSSPNHFPPLRKGGLGGIHRTVNCVDHCLRLSQDLPIVESEDA